MVGTWLDALRERLVIFGGGGGGVASMPMRLVIIVAFVFLLAFVWFCRGRGGADFFLCYFAFVGRWGMWPYVILLSWGGLGGM